MKTLQEIKELAEKAKNGGAAYGEFLDHLDGETITALIALVKECEEALESAKSQWPEKEYAVRACYDVEDALQSIKDFGKE